MEERLVLDNIKLIYKCIKDLNCQYKTEDEFQNYYDAGLVGLINGAKTYDPSVAKQSTYLYKCIKNGITRYFQTSESDCRKINKMRKTSIDDNVYDESDLTYAEIIPDPNVDIEQEIENQIKLEAVIKCLDYIDKKDALIIRKYYGICGEERKSLEEIGKQLGVSRERANQRRARGIRKIKAKIDVAERKVIMGENKAVAFVERKETKEDKNILQQVNTILLEQLNTLKNLDLNDKEYSKMEIARSNAVSNTSKIILQTIGVQMMADRRNYNPLQIENK